MTKSLHWLLAVSIPILIVVIFYLVYSNTTVSDTEKVCTYVSSGTCVKESVREGTIKNIDLNKYNIDSSSNKVGDKIVYEVRTEKEKRTQTLIIVSIICFILIFFIRFPFLWYLFIIGI